MHLDRAVDHVVQHARGEELDHRDLDARLVARRRSCARRRASSAGRRGCRPRSPRSSSGPSACRRAASRTPRARARSEHISSNARCIWPSQRITWWMRPGPEPLLRDPEPVARLAERVLDRHADAACTRPRSASTSRARGGPMHRHGANDLDARRIGRDDDLRRARSARGASGSVTAITIAKAAPSAPDENHLCPSITHSSPSRTARVRSVRRVGARDLGLGHREERANLAGDERARASAPSARRCRTGAGSRRSRRRAPGSRRRTAPTSSGRSPRSGSA